MSSDLVIDCKSGASSARPAVIKDNIGEMPPQPLDAAGVAATLNVVLGLWSLKDAANAVNQPEQALIDEAEAWYYVEQEGPL
jgi:hypothetical protein